jgi:tRNA A-37 threonylcarbamoyl transferase component Bud32/HAMP domain-containing protein
MEHVGRYEIVDVIGEGAMARVYRAHDPEIGRTVAIKLLKSQLRDDWEYRTRFLREAKGAGVLSHPNIVTVFDAGEQDGHPYMAMEFVEGATLADVIRDKKPLSLAAVVGIGIQLAKALDYAHQKGIVHRDVKPGNIMLLRDGLTIKVADFGICRIDDSEATQATQVGNVLGTPHYMSPEQVQGEKADARSDLFSAGVVLYQLLTSTLPFEGDTLITVAYKITKTEPTPLDKLRPDLPLSLRRIVDRSLRKQPEKRFQSGGELAQALIGVARELAETGGAKKELRIPLRVRWALIMAAVVAVTMTVSAAFIYNKQRHAMMDQVMSYGASLVKFMATQTAVPMLAEDWSATDVLVQETIGRQDFAYLVVIDDTGVIRGSNDAAQEGTPYTAPQLTPIATREDSVNVQRTQLTDGRDVLDFASPILFQDKPVGQVHLGIFEAPLAAVANLTLVLLGILIVVTSAAVAIGSYLLAQRLSEPLRVLRNSLAELAKGRYDYRISDTRRDEFGELYTTFDQTADALQRRHDSADAPAEQPTPAPNQAAEPVKAAD